MIIGLTGGIGSGKTTVSNLFQEKGIDIIDADIIARSLTKKNTDTLATINHHFGGNLLIDKGELDRHKLREIIFSDPKAKAWLDQYSHPKIRAQLELQANNSTSPYCLIVIPLLVEADTAYHFLDRILVVDCEKELQIKRVMARDNNTLEQSQSIIAQQASRQKRLAIADDIITNNHDHLELEQQVNKLHQHYLALAQ